MENFYDVGRIEFTIKSATNLELVVETSYNQKDWKEVAKGSYKAGSEQLIVDIEDKEEVRFLKVNVRTKDKDAPFAIGEIEVFGKTD